MPLLLQEEVLMGSDMNGYVSVEHINKTFEDCSSLFEGIHTQYLVDKFLIDQGKLIKPQKVLIGTYWAWRYKPKTKVIKCEHVFYNIPFIQSLTQLLNQKDVMMCVNNPKPLREGGYFNSYGDGNYVKSHPIFKDDKQALMIIVYYDDVEIANPLGSKCKVHKLGLFYWTLGNIYSEYRSTLKAINLLAVAKTVLIRKYGVNKILEQFVQEMKLLENNDGVMISVNGNLKRFCGSLLFFTGDTLASNYVGGYKEGVSFANRPCRVCMGTKTSIKSTFVESNFEMRNALSHVEQCDSINEPNLSKEARDFWTKTYGINEKSILVELNTFDITKCMVQDLMHVGIEGILELEIRYLLKYCVKNKFITLSYINGRISDFSYGHLAKDRPSAIESQHLDNKLRQNAAQTMALGNILPFFLFGRIPYDDERLCNLVLLLQILNLMLAFKIKESDIMQLKKMIEIHHICFATLYPERPTTPKFHFFIHMPEQILRFGPLRQQWCMRFEAAHCRMKALAAVVKNFKNISYTLAYRCQSLRCSQLLTTTPSVNFLYAGHLVKSGTTIIVNDHANANLIINELGILDPDTSILLTKEICVYGTTYRRKSVLLISENDDDLPSFALIDDIVINGSNMLLIYNKLLTLSFNDNLNAYCVAYCRDEVAAIKVENLIHPHALSLFVVNGNNYVILLHHRRTEVY